MQPPHHLSTEHGVYRPAIYVFERGREALLVVRLRPVALTGAEAEWPRTVLRLLDERGATVAEYVVAMRWCGRRGLASLVTVDREQLAAASHARLLVEGAGEVPAPVAHSVLFTARVSAHGGACEGRAAFVLVDGCTPAVEYAVRGGELVAYVPAGVYDRVVFDCGGAGVTWLRVPVEPPEVSVRVTAGRVDVEGLVYGAVGGDTLLAVYKPVEWRTRRSLAPDHVEVVVAGRALPALAREGRALRGLGYLELAMFRLPPELVPSVYHARLRLCHSGSCSEVLMPYLELP